MRDMNAQRLVLTMTDGTVFRGFTNIGSSRRLSDFFRKSDSMFMVLFDATLGESDEKGVYFINRNHILWAQPDEVAESARVEPKLTIERDKEDLP